MTPGARSPAPDPNSPGAQRRDPSAQLPDIPETPKPLQFLLALSFLNDLVANVPTAGVNVIVLQDTPTPFAAGIAANLIAAQVTGPGPGFFVYFNSGLDLPRLVFSADLSDNTADLAILARMTNLSGQPGRDALPTFSESNFVFAQVPEPGSLMMLGVGLAAMGGRAWRRRRALR